MPVDMYNFTICHVIKNDIFPIIILLFTYFYFSFPALHQLLRWFQLQQGQVLLLFCPSDVAIVVDAMPSHLAIYYLGSGLLTLSFCRT